MAIHLETDSQPATATLVQGIIHDAHDLLDQQLKLFQVEIKNHVRKTWEASVPLLLGVLISIVGTTTLALAGGYLLSWAWPSLPLWGGLGIIGSALILTGAGLALWGKCRLTGCDTTPDDQGHPMKETNSWKAKN